MHLFQQHPPQDLDAALATLPIIDLGPYRSGEDGALNRLADEIKNACETIGFFYVINHGIPEELIANAFAQSRRFHALPLEEKKKIPLDEHNVGYLATNASIQGHSTVHKATKPNQNESFFITHDRGPDHPDVIAKTPLRGGNYWPENLPGFREGVMAYFRALNDLGQQLVPAFAVALGLEPDGLAADFANENNAKLRMLHYPPTQVEDNDFGAGPHTDNSFLTILARDEVPGLAIRLPSGEWLAPPLIPGAFLINIGNMVRRMSNDQFLSTPHGVIVDGETDRYSMAYFHSPNVTRAIGVAPSCIDADHPAKYEPALYADLIREFYSVNYSHQEGYGKTEIKNRYD
ncbi:MAG: isopenicillin N synthase family oxygenase [Rhodospirillaceae bacterium]|mgnify:CR=1 FL=1|jgi:isopenicillin N synthase-like dioxygenase|nr:isopenicillin N synthase family oxygenase [Rhodospirillaceae bacterium]MBT5666476.1 isopenicillin N synthase family oxygenase [Rhodospirillaceae bacterium]MBT5811620.1 isopenicillin N synthase family oxygenase [Rhodospirillaceae bacterium]